MKKAPSESSAGVPPASETLPPGWTLTMLGEVVEASPEKIDPADQPDAPYIGLEHIESGTKRLCGVGKASDVRSAKSVFRAGDILYGKLRPYLNKIIRPDFAGVCSTDILVIRATAKVETAFIEYLMSMPRFTEFAMSSSAGINLPRTSYKKLAEFPIALPPLPEQRRIVARMKSLEARSRRAREKLAAVPAQLAQARQSLLAAAFRGNLTADWRSTKNGGANGHALLAELKRLHDETPGKKGNAAQATEGVHELSTDEIPNTWAIAELRALCSPDKPICYGILMPGPELKAGVPYVRVADFPKDVIRMETVRNTSPEIDAMFVRSRLAAGDILLSIRGTVGRVAIVPAGLEGANITQDTARLSIHRSVNAEYVAWMLRSPDTQARMQAAVKGVAVRGINIGDVRPLQIPLPPLPEQHEIVRRLNAAFAKLDAAALAHAAAVTALDRLDQSLLARAFSGGLVAQNAAPDPATAAMSTSVQAQTYLLRFIPALLRAAGHPVSLDDLNRAVALRFLPESELLPVVERLGGAEARAHFATSTVAYEDGAFLAAMRLLRRSEAVTVATDRHGIQSLSLGSKPPPSTASIDADALHLAPLLGRVPAKCVTPTLRRLQSVEVREALLATA